MPEHSRPLSNVEAVSTSGLSHLVSGPLRLVPRPSCQAGALPFSVEAPMSDAKTILSGTGIFPKSAVSCDHPSSSGLSSLLPVSLSAVLTLSSGSESLHCMLYEDAFPHIK